MILVGVLSVGEQSWGHKYPGGGETMVEISTHTDNTLLRSRGRFCFPSGPYPRGKALSFFHESKDIVFDIAILVKSPK